jgi:hypothetical protein
MAQFSPSGPRRGLGIDHLNRRITDLKVEGSPSHSPISSPSCQQGKTGNLGSSDLMGPRLPQNHLVSFHSFLQTKQLKLKSDVLTIIFDHFRLLLSDHINKKEVPPQHDETVAIQL